MYHGRILKTATYQVVGGGKIDIEYNPDALCRICWQPVDSASMGGTKVCPSCDCGHCRYCGMEVTLFNEDIDGGDSLRRFREHVAREAGQ